MNVTAKFSKTSIPKAGTLVVFAAKGGKLSGKAAEMPGADAISKSLKAADFEGKFGKSLKLYAPGDSELDCVIVMGVGDSGEISEQDWLNLGGKITSALSGMETATIAMDGIDSVTGEQTAAIAQGAKLAGYKFDKYKTGKSNKADKDDKGEKSLSLTFLTEDKSAASAWQRQEAIADGVMFARDLVNEPANVLTPKDFAKRLKKLERLGCDVEILNEKDMKKLKMRTLLGVARGSRNAPRMAIVKWNGGAKDEKPVAFIGKGVTFDTGGISIKPSAGMEDMKGDMGGAAAVSGLMMALAGRKAKVNAVGIVAAVENMPDGDAQRPGDIVKTMSGQTVEILNTDAEGRLVLADALWHCREEFDPKFMINLATLTGAILVALGTEHAGLFSNNDELSEQLHEAGQVTEEKVWRLPLTKGYDKMIDTPNADMKNIGGRYAGSITAAQFLQRFVEDTPWAHLDVAGTAMKSPKTDINSGWASGYGVRLLDRLVGDHYEG